MFEIGNSLREARRRRGLDIAACEQGTKIRSKYLTALEEEHFDVLPAPAYCKAFLRSYADYLGLDGDRVLDEYCSRFEPEGERLAEVREAAERRMARRRRFFPFPPKPSGRRGGGGWQLVWIGAGGAAAVALLVWAGASGRNASPTAVPAPPTDGTEVVAPPTTSAPERTAPTRPAPPPGVQLALTGVGEGSYVQVRRGDSAGEVLFEGVVAPGASRRWRDRSRLWMRVGWTPNLRVRVNGQPVEAEGGTVNLVATRRGLTPAG